MRSGAGAYRRVNLFPTVAGQVILPEGGPRLPADAHGVVLRERLLQGRPSLLRHGANLSQALGSLQPHAGFRIILQCLNQDRNDLRIGAGVELAKLFRCGLAFRFTWVGLKSADHLLQPLGRIGLCVPIEDDPRKDGLGRQGDHRCDKQITAASHGQTPCRIVVSPRAEVPVKMRTFKFCIGVRGGLG